MCIKQIFKKLSIFRMNKLAKIIIESFKYDETHLYPGNTEIPSLIQKRDKEWSEPKRPEGKILKEGGTPIPYMHDIYIKSDKEITIKKGSAMGMTVLPLKGSIPYKMSELLQEIICRRCLKKVALILQWFQNYRRMKTQKRCENGKNKIKSR